MPDPRVVADPAALAVVAVVAADRCRLLSPLLGGRRLETGSEAVVDAYEVVVEKVVAADGEVLLDNSDMEGEQRVNKDVANNLISAMEPIAGASRNHALAGGRTSAANASE